MANPVAFTTLDPGLPKAIERVTSNFDLDRLELEIARTMVVGRHGSRAVETVAFATTAGEAVWPESVGVRLTASQEVAAAIAAADAVLALDSQVDAITRMATSAVHGASPRKAAAGSAASIDDAMRHVQSDFVDRLESAGLGREIALAVLELVNVTADAKVVQQQIVSKRVELAGNAAAATTGSSVRVVASDPMQPLSANELGERLGLHEQTVRTREREGKLFSILRAGRQRGQEFPAFQALPGVVGKPLEDTLAALVPAGQTRPVTGPEAYGFLTSPTDLLADLSPVEVLLGRQLSPRAIGTAAADVLAYTPEVRLQLVVDTARAMAASDNA